MDRGWLGSKYIGLLNPKVYDQLHICSYSKHALVYGQTPKVLKQKAEVIAMENRGDTKYKVISEFHHHDEPSRP